MGFGVTDVQVVQRLRQTGYLPSGSAIVEIGAQQLNGSIFQNPDCLAEMGRVFGVSDPPPQLAPGVPTPEDALAGAPRTRQVWIWLGFSYAAIDIDSSPGSLALDLNYDAVPLRMRGSHQLVTNYGSTEHVANQLNAFKAIHDLTAVDGVMIHNVPANLPDHGLFGYNAKFFWQLCRANDYRVVVLEAEGPSIYAVLQKRHDIEFVPPLDVYDGISTDNEALRDRYWTIFDNKALEKIQRDSILKMIRRNVAQRYPWLGAAKRWVIGAMGSRPH